MVDSKHKGELALVRTSVAQKLRILATPAIMIVMFAFLALRGSWWWLGTVPLMPILAANASIAMHDVGHGLVSGRSRHWLLFVLGAAHMLSGHTFWAAHSQHHRRFPASDSEDPEGAPAHWPFATVLRYGMLFFPRLWYWVWRTKPSARRWLLAELLATLAVLVLSVLVWQWLSSPALLVYALSLLVSSWMGYAVIAWISHQRDILAWPRRQALAGTMIGAVLAYFFGVIIFHDEHHARESVPSCNLAEFARSRTV